ncbi:snRNA-activating protein complex subunit 4 isoform X2 [Anolis carolinensis]|uniref:snRNA-activating protein complex subunit 4 isoform X2 n=1 Tax=Anolis carolinensis TaxID=28377 RepID=UPI002F2B2CB8
MDIDAEREKIRQEIEELERNLGPGLQNVDLNGSNSSLESEDEGSSDDSKDLDAQVEMVDQKSPLMEGESEAILHIPQTPETCLQMNLVYQAVLQEKLEEVRQLLAQNKDQQEKLTWNLSEKRVAKSGAGKPLPANLYLGHFMKPYFKDASSGVGPPANSDKRDKAKQGIKGFEELRTVTWKSREKQLLRESVLSDRLQHLLQPKLLSLNYLNEKLTKSRDEVERQILEKQIKEKADEIAEINLLPEEYLLANRFEEHDWEKIANVNFDGTRSAKELQRFWQNSEHPDINRKEWSPEETEALKEIATRRNGFDWAAIAQELGTQRTAFQCLQKFQTYNKDLKKREWTPEEDQMLLQMVREMRVGKHIPYRKIAYYMEGRDPAQLIYRWTKRVDPKLKHGPWTPKEDALLLKAVGKFGERDWYKIRAEVPGRSDQQCRERYLNSLNFDIKKGKWSEEEEKKLVELTEKYGVGHWAKIASELPHRSGTQCLSKWKVLLGYKRKQTQKRRRRKAAPRKRVPRVIDRPLESSSDTSDLDPDSESEEEDEDKGRKEEKDKRPWRVPDLDLWVPTRKGGDQKTGSPQQTAKRANDSWKVSLDFVKNVLRRNTNEMHRRNREIRRRKRFSASDPHGPFRPHVPPGRRIGPWRTSLHRRLLLAVSSWAKGRVQERVMQAQQEAGTTTKVEFISRALKSVRLPSSTPLFTLFIQLLHIDASGCMKVIQKQKSRPTEKRQTEQVSSTALPCRLAGKSRTVSELLREKRLRAAQAQKAQQKQQGLALLAPKILLRPQIPAPNLQISMTGRPNPGVQVPVAGCPSPAPNLQILAPNLQTPRVDCSSPNLQIPTPNLQTPRVDCSSPNLQIPTPNLQTPRVDCSSPNLQIPTPNLQTPRVDCSSPNLQIPTPNLQTPRVDCSSPNLQIPTPNLQTPRVDCSSPNIQIPTLNLQTPRVECSSPNLQIPTPNLQTPRVDCSSPNIQIPTLNLQIPRVECSSPNLQIPTPNLQTPRVECSSPNLQIPTPNLQTPRVECSSPNLQIPTPNLQIPRVECSSPNLPIPTPNLQTPRVECSSPNLPMPTAERLNLHIALNPTAPGTPSSDPAPPMTLTLTWILTPQGLLPVVRLPGQTADPATCPPKQAPVASTQVPTSGDVVSEPHNAVVPSEAAPSRPVLGDPPEKAPLDYRLLSTEDPAAAKQWLQGEGGSSGLPYLPPFLCNLRTLSTLLRHKEALLSQATSLRVPEGSGATGLRTLVQQRLWGNPAYDLLKARFLAAFTFPAALAALPPFRVSTTISRVGLDPSSEEEDDDDNDMEVEREPHDTARDGPGEAANGHESPTEMEVEETAPEVQESGVEGSNPKPSNPEPFALRRSSRVPKRKKQP